MAAGKAIAARALLKPGFEFDPLLNLNEGLARQKDFRYLLTRIRIQSFPDLLLLNFSSQTSINPGPF